MVGNQLIKQYNGKPFLSYGSADRDVFPNDKIVVTVDVYKFSYAMRNFYFSILQTEDPSVLNNAVVDMAFFPRRSSSRTSTGANSRIICHQ